jgi:hypothetical protein
MRSIVIQNNMLCETAYLASVRKQFITYKALGDKAIARLNEEELLYQPEQGSNSIAIIIRHLHGNMKSRFTNFLTEDGEKPWRERESEFLSPGTTIQKDDLVSLWEEGWACLLQAIDQVQPEQLMSTVYIRHEPHLAIDAFNRQLAHYASHVGQIVYLAKLILGPQWESLSIAKGESAKFNVLMAKKFKAG